MSDHPDIDWASQHIPQGRTVVGYAAGRIPADAYPDVVIAVTNRAAEIVNRNSTFGKLSARQAATTFVTMPLDEVPSEVFDDGHNRSVDLAVVAIAHMPEDAGRIVGVLERHEACSASGMGVSPMGDADAMVAWLRAQWDADEQAAREAMSRSADEWRFAPDDLGIWPGYVSAMDGSTEYPLVTGAQSYVGDMITEGIAAHIARHDPAGTLARIEGERRIMELHLPRRVRSTSGEGHVDVCRMCDQFPARYPCGTLRALAWGYRHRDGWQEGWAP